MNFDKFIEPKNITIGDRTYTISQIPALEALPLTNVICKALADYGRLGIMMLPPAIDRQILSYTAWSDDVKIVPETDQLFGDVFKGRMDDAKALVIEMVKLNFDFLITGALLERLEAPQESGASAS